MKDKENRYIPDGLDWDDMKHGIFQKVRDLEQEKAKRKNRLLVVWLMGIGLLLVVTFVIKHMHSNNYRDDSYAVKHSKVSHNYSLIREDDTCKLIGSNSLSLDIGLHALDTFSGGLYSMDEGVAKSVSKDYESQEYIEQAYSNIMTAPEKSDVKPSSLLELIFDHSLNMISNGENVEIGTYDPIPRQAVDISKLPTSHFMRPFNMGENLWLQNIQLKYSNISNLDVEADIDFNHQIIIQSGLSIWDEGYSDSEPERSVFENTTVSPCLEIVYSRMLQRGIFFSGGLSYKEMGIQLDYNSGPQTYMETLRDTIASVQVDALTGSETIRRQDVLHSYTAERRVRHFNKFRMINLTLGAGKSLKFNRIVSDVYLGTTIGLTMHRAGRTIVDGQVVDFKDTQVPLFSNQTRVEAQFGCRIHYMIRENFSLLASMQSHFNLRNWSAEDGIQMYPYSLEFQVGFGKRF